MALVIDELVYNTPTNNPSDQFVALEVESELESKLCTAF